MNQPLKHLRRVTLTVIALLATAVGVSMQYFSTEAFHSTSRKNSAPELWQNLDDAPAFPPPASGQTTPDPADVSPSQEVSLGTAGVEQGAPRLLVLDSPGTESDTASESHIITLAAYTQTVEQESAPGLNAITLTQGHSDGHVETPAPDDTQQDDRTQEIADLLALGDDALRVGDISGALRSYSHAAELGESPIQPLIHFRLGLANEAAGSLNRSLDYYQRVSSEAPGTIWDGLCTAGKVRCWRGLNKSDLVMTEGMHRCLLDPRGLNSGIVEELLMCIADSLAQSLPNLERSPRDLLDDTRLLAPVVRFDPVRTLDLARKLIDETPPAVPAVGITVNHQFARSAEATFLSAHLEGVPLIELLNSLTTAGGLNCKISPAAAESMQGDRATAVNRNIRLSSALDALCCSRKLIWQENDGTVAIFSWNDCKTETVNGFLSNLTRRFLEMTIAEYPDNVLSKFNHVYLGILRYSHQDMQEAAAILKAEATGTGPPSLRATAAYNLGKCLLHSGNSQEALDAFLITSDLHSSDSLTLGAAQLYTARLQLESFETRPAISSAMRGLSLCESSPLESAAVELLASAYLLTENAHGANTVLMKYRTPHVSQDTADRLAFLAALARFDASVLQDRREREALSLAEAVSHVDPALGFGDYWWLLIGRASDDIGLKENAVNTYLKGLNSRPSQAVRTKLLLEVLEINPQLGKPGSSDRENLILSQPVESTVRETVRVQNMESLLKQGNLPMAIQIGTELLAECDHPRVRRDTLKLLGKAYQRSGDYQAAIQCFSGEIPGPAQSSHTEIHQMRRERGDTP